MYPPQLEQPESRKMLLGILGRTTAVWRPQRQADWAGPASANLYFARKVFIEAGIPATIGGGNAARVEGHRRLGALADAGLAVVTQHRGRPHVRLADDVEWYLRALCGLSGAAATWQRLRQVVELARRPKDHCDWGLLCSELWLTGMKDYGVTTDYQVRLWHLQNELLPTLSRQWVIAESDRDGRAYYSPTDLGRKVAAAPEPVEPIDLPEATRAAWKIYDDENARYRQVLRAAKPESEREIGILPLPCSLDLRRPTTNRRKARA